MLESQPAFWWGVSMMVSETSSNSLGGEVVRGPLMQALRSSSQSRTRSAVPSSTWLAASRPGPCRRMGTEVLERPDDRLGQGVLSPRWEQRLIR